MVEEPTTVEEISPIERLKIEVQRNPKVVGNHLRLGWMYYGEGAFEDAVRTFQYAKDRFPADVEVLYGFTLASKKKRAGSSKHWMPFEKRSN
jgi:hypothetical protein